VGDTYSLIHNQKTVRYTAVSGDTTALVAAGLASAATSSGTAEWSELLASSAGAVVTILGPADGTPFTLTTAVTGSATLTAGTPAAGVSPHDLADAANYAGGALPVNSDTLTFPADGADVRTGLTALTAVTGLVIRRDAGGPVVGLPDYRSRGYREYRPTFLEVPAATVLVHLSARDRAGAFRLDCDATATVVSVIGEQAGRLDGEQVEVKGGTGACAVRLANAAVAVVGGAVAVLAADGGVVRVEAGVTLGAVELKDTTARIGATWTALDVTGGQVDVMRAATGPLTLRAGTVNWKGSGNFNAPQLGVGAVLSTQGGADPIAVTGVIVKLGGNAVLDDPFTRITRPYSVDLLGSGPSGLNVGPDARITVAARP